MNRKMRINFKDGEHTDLKISKAAVMRLGKKGKKANNSVHIEEMDDGTYRLLWSEGLMENFSDVVNIEMIRDDNDEQSV
jgi:hypothetical protein